MDFVYSIPVVSPRDALAFIYDSGKQTSTQIPEDPSKGNLINDNSNHSCSAFSSPGGDQALEMQESRTASSTLPYLEMLLALKSDHKGEATSYSSSFTTGESDADEIPLETRTAQFHTAYGLVESVIEKVICERNIPVQRYKNALRQYILGSTLPTSLVNKALELLSSENKNALDSPGHPPSPKYYGSLVSYVQAGEETVSKTRQALLHRYEKCCEALGVVPVSSVMARIAPEIENRTFNSLTYELGQSATMPPTLNSSNTHIGQSIAEPQPDSSIVSLIPPLQSLPCAAKETSSPQVLKKSVYLHTLPPEAPPQGGGCAKPLENTDSQCLPSTDMGSSDAISLFGGASKANGGVVDLKLANDNALCVSTHLSGRHSPCKDATPWVRSHTASHFEPREEHCELDFTSCGVGSAENMIPLFRALEEYPEVTLLSLASTGIDDAGVRVLVHLCEAFFTNLRSLDLGNNPLITDRSGPSLRNLLQRRRTLQFVQTSGSGFSNFWVKTINILSHRNSEEMK